MTAAATMCAVGVVVGGCAGRAGSVPPADQGVEAVAMHLIAVACDTAAAQALLLSHDQLIAMTRRAESERDYASDRAWLVDHLCSDLERHAAGGHEVVAANVDATADRDPELKQGVEATSIRYVTEQDGVRSSDGHPFLFVRTPGGWRLAWIRERPSEP